MPSFPYFGMYVKYDTYQQMYTTPDYNSFFSLEEAMKDVVEMVLERIASKKTLFEYTTYSRNTGGCKSYPSTQWLFAGQNPISDKYQEYGIAFSKEVPVEEIIAFGAKIQKRHEERFLATLAKEGRNIEDLLINGRMTEKKQNQNMVDLGIFKKYIQMRKMIEVQPSKATVLLDEIRSVVGPDHLKYSMLTQSEQLITVKSFFLTQNL